MMISRNNPVPVTLPGVVYEAVKNLPIDEPNTASKIRTMLDYFFTNKPQITDMSSVDLSGTLKSFTLRLSDSELEKLNKFCRSTLYTRPQAFQVTLATVIHELTEAEELVN